MKDYFMGEQMSCSASAVLTKTKMNYWSHKYDSCGEWCLNDRCINNVV